MIDLSERKIRFFVTQLRWTPRCELRDYRKLEFHHILGRLFRGEMSCGKRIRYNRATSRDLHQSYVTERKLSAPATDQRRLVELNDATRGLSADRGSIERNRSGGVPILERLVPPFEHSDLKPVV